MQKFREKPVVIDAIQWDGKEELEAFDDYVQLTCPQCKKHTNHGVISTMEGILHACPGDWIIKGIKGEYYPCKPNIFEETYEKVSE